MSRTFLLVVGILLLVSQGVLGSADKVSDTITEIFATPPSPAIPERSPAYPPIDFRGLIAPIYPDPPFADHPGWEKAGLAFRKEEGYNTISWLVHRF